MPFIGNSKIAFYGHPPTICRLQRAIFFCLFAFKSNIKVTLFCICNEYSKSSERVIRGTVISY